MKKKTENANKSSSLLSNEYFIVALFSFAPVINFASFNIGETGFTLTRSLLHFSLLFVTGVIFVWISNKLLRGICANKIAFFYGLVVFLTFNGYLIDQFVFKNFQEIFNTAPRIRHVLLLYFSGILLCALLTYLISRFKNASSLIVVAFIAIALTDTITVAQSMLSMSSSRQIDSDSEEDSTAVTSQHNTSKPNVYFLLPDMMIGEEMFEKYDIDKDILANIENRGFRTINKAYANGPVTYFSLPHIFGMNYYLKDGETVSKERLHGEIKNIFGKGNKVYREFKKRNYRIFSLDDGYLPSNCNIGEDKCIDKSERSVQNQQDLRFIERTPLLKTLNVLDMKFNLFSVPLNLWAYPNRIEVPDIIRQFPEPEEGPYFFYMHIGIPHYPLRFDENCNYTRFDDTATAYSQQYKCGVKHIELIVDTILEKDKDALFVIHSDHGVSFPGQHLKQVEDLQDDEIREVLSIYSSFRLPVQCDSYLRDGLSPVNTFRVIFACLDNRKPELLEDKSYLVFYPKWPSGGKVREWRH